MKQHEETAILPSRFDENLAIKISVVVPVYNEERILESLFADLDRFAFHELIIVDGRGGDGTFERCQDWAREPDVPCPRKISSEAMGRAKQMNAGAKTATGDVVLFLHADSILPPDTLNKIDRAFKTPDIVGGAFLLKIDSPHPYLGFVSWMANMRTRYLCLPYGDQAYFVRRTVFERLGGYREIPLMEDVDFFQRLKRMGRIAILKDVVRSSARKWDQGGIYLNSFRNLFILFSYFVGISPKRLARWYTRKH